MAHKVWLDAGHGGSDPGACAFGLVEKTMNLISTLEAKRVLEAHGVQVGLSRSTDVYVGIDARPQKANAWGADLFVSIHYNAGGGDGAEAIHSVVGGASKRLAETIVDTIKSELGQNLRPRKVFSRTGSSGKDYHGVIRGSKMPATIVEGAFVDSADRLLVDTVAEQKKMGEAIAHGILKYLGVKGTPVTEASKPATSTPASTTTYKVVKGDTLSGIAVKYKTTVAAIKSLNGLKSDVIQIGQVLKVAGKAPAPTPAPKPAATTTYKVVSGNTLSGIAVKFGTNVTAIKQLNGLSSDLIRVGQVLKVPATKAAAAPSTPATYKVVKGDTLSEIGVKYGVTVSKLKSLNGLKSDVIQIGQVLKLK